VIFFLDEKLIFANIGDSRAFLSKNRGQEIQICSYDHKPHFFGEMQRIFKHNGQLYRVCSNKTTGQTEIFYALNHQEFLQIDRIPEESSERIFGPWRVKPGGLSVSHFFP
jgi:serine/threonine protein phosphatase PrpC